jgi:hypothetical protein
MGGIYRSSIKTEFFMFARFEQFLVGNGAVPSKQIPYYVKWVRVSARIRANMGNKPVIIL